MPDSPRRTQPAQGTRAEFCDTHWSLVLAAIRVPSSDATEPLGELCRNYWYPLYAFVRRRGHAPHDAQDLTQSFFGHILEKDTLKNVAPSHGRFRSFLLAALTNFLNNEWQKQRTLKGGGNFQLVSWDEVAPEKLYAHEPADHATPEKIFERRWAFAIIERVAARLKREYAASDKAELYEKLHPYLSADPAPGAYAESAATLAMNEGALRVALHRLRRRFGELLRHEIAQTVSKPSEVDEEIRHLFAAIGE